MYKKITISFLITILLISMSSYPYLPENFKANNLENDSISKNPSELLKKQSTYFEEILNTENNLPIYMSKGLNYSTVISPDEIHIDFYKNKGSGDEPKKESFDSINIKYINSNSCVSLKGENELVGKSNYFIGNDKNKWKTGISLYEKVKCENIYEGIDILYYSVENSLEYDFIVSPGANIKDISMKIENADKVFIDKGNLVIQKGENHLIHKIPSIYQIINGEKICLDGKFVIKDDNTIGFNVNGFNPKETTIIDPRIEFSTYFGGDIGDWIDWAEPRDEICDVATDISGNIYITGYKNYIICFPHEHEILPEGPLPLISLYITKFDSDGDRIFTTELGSNRDSCVSGIDVDDSGNIYITGTTYADRFPTENAYQTYSIETPSAACYIIDAFMLKLNSSGDELLYSTYLGGNNIDEGYDIAVDNSGIAYVTGYTCSADFPTKNPVQPELCIDESEIGTPVDAFVTIIDTNLSGEDSLVSSTFLGGTGTDKARSIAVDETGNIYVTGGTNSDDFIRLNEYQSYSGVCKDAFITKYSPNAENILYSTYLSSDSNTEAYGIDVDDDENVYIVGKTDATEPNTFPLRNEYENSSYHISTFLSRVDTTVSGDEGLIYSTLFGGISCDYGLDIVVNSEGIAYITGKTFSYDFPILNAPSGYDYNSGCYDSFMAQFNTNNVGIGSLIASLLIGGSRNDAGMCIALDPTGAILVGGNTFSTDFPTTERAYQEEHADEGLSSDGFLVKITDIDRISLHPLPDGMADGPYIFWQPPSAEILIDDELKFCRPIAVQKTTEDIFKMNIGLPVFEGNVDIYIMLCNENLENTFYISPDGDLKLFNGEYIPWRSNINGNTSNPEIGSICIQNMQKGNYEIQLIVTTAGSQSFKNDYYSWKTNIEIK